WRKLVVLFSGMRVRLDAVRGPPFQYPHEIPVGEEGAARRFVLMPKIMDDEEAVEVFRRLRRAGVTEVWVSHTLPFLVFIALGYLAALLLGDVALWMLRRLMAR
ncbi:MAG: A24 family peptidase C-terminal domain-containing protein, partial [Candidatus Bathyarchaeia archaeon]